MIKSLQALLSGLVFLVLGAFAANAEEITLTNASGQAVNANLQRAEGKTLADGVVLLTHGTLAHNKMEIISTLQELLAERGINSLAPTLSLGIANRTGMYDCTVPHTHKHTDALGEIGLWLNWLKAQGAADVVLAGHSRGGNQTAWFAAYEPDPAVSKVVLIAPATWYQDKAARSFDKNNKRPLKEVMREANALIRAGEGDTVLKGVGMLYCTDADATAASFASYNRHDERFHTPHLIPLIGKPTLVVVGSEDTVVEGLVNATRPLADAGKVELAVIDGADHFFLDLYAEDLADAVEAFIAD